MTAPRVSYAHLLVQPNPRHVRSLVRFFEEGCSAPGTGGFGVEVEHLPVHNADDTAVTYGEPNGVEELLRRLRPYYDSAQEYWQDDHLVGLAREGIAISLEPGGQIETSIGILRKPEDLLELHGQFMRGHSTQPQTALRRDERVLGAHRAVRTVHDARIRLHAGEHRLYERARRDRQDAPRHRDRPDPRMVLPQYAVFRRCAEPVAVVPPAHVGLPRRAAHQRDAGPVRRAVQLGGLRSRRAEHPAHVRRPDPHAGSGRRVCARH